MVSLLIREISDDSSIDISLHNTFIEDVIHFCKASNGFQSLPSNYIIVIKVIIDYKRKCIRSMLSALNWLDEYSDIPLVSSYIDIIEHLLETTTTKCKCLFEWYSEARIVEKGVFLGEPMVIDTEATLDAVIHTGKYKREHDEMMEMLDAINDRKMENAMKRVKI
jgi:hypothetical protein